LASSLVKFDENILGQIVLGNPKKDYNTLDVNFAVAIANIYAIALKRLLY
jgi:hypothetical protein